jgi:hypothetical protein
LQTLRKPWSTLPGRCRAGVAGLPTRRQQLTSWLKQNEGHDVVALGIDLLEHRTCRSLTTRGRVGVRVSECSAGAAWFGCRTWTGAVAVFESQTELCERLGETPLASVCPAWDRARS